MSGNREPVFQRDTAWTMRNGVFMGLSDYGTPCLESDARSAGRRHGLVDQRMPARTTAPAFGHLPPWAQPAWIQRLPR